MNKSIDITHIKSHVINLKSNIEKLERVQKSLNAISIFPERFDAVYGKDLDPLYIEKYQNNLKELYALRIIN